MVCFSNITRECLCVNWLRNIINNDSYKIFILTDGTIHYGQIRFYKDKETNVSIDYSIDAMYRNQGLGKRMIRLGISKITMDVWDINLIYAIVKKENIISQKVFESLGFMKTDNDDNLLKYTLGVKVG